MSKLELLRHQVHDLVEQIEDEQLLNLLHKTAIDGVLAHDGNLWDDLSEQDKLAIRQSIEQVKEGKILGHDEVMKKHAPWRFK